MKGPFEKPHPVRVEGKVHHDNIGQFRMKMDEALNRTQLDVLLDLSQAEHLASPAIGIIQSTELELNKSGRQMHVELGDNPEDILYPFRMSGIRGN